MPAVTPFFYGLTMEKIAEQVGNDVNYLTGTVKLSLHGSGYTPNRDTDNFFDDAGDQLAGVSGYTTGGETLGGKTITYDAASDQVRWDANDVTWNFTGTQTIKNGVMYIDTAGGASTDPLYAVLIWDTEFDVDVTYTLQWDAAGILYVDTSP